MDCLYCFRKTYNKAFSSQVPDYSFYRTAGPAIRMWLQRSRAPRHCWSLHAHTHVTRGSSLSRFQRSRPRRSRRRHAAWPAIATHVGSEQPAAEPLATTAVLYDLVLRVEPPVALRNTRTVLWACRGSERALHSQSLSSCLGMEGAAAGGSGPSPLEIVEYARWIGMDPLADSELLWICEEALQAPLPQGWSEHFDQEDEAYYHDLHTGETTREHPLDSHYRQLYQSLKQRAAQPAPAPQPPPRRASAAPGGPALAPACVPRPPRPATVSVAPAGTTVEPSVSAAAAAVAEAARQVQAQRVAALARAHGQPAASAAEQLPGVRDAEDEEVGDDEKYRVGRCVVTSRELGHGSSGSLVHRGYWGGHPCAVKCLRKLFWALAQKDLKAVLGLWAEETTATTAAGGHTRDHLLRYFGVEEDREFVYLCMERCKRPLSQIVESGGAKSWDPRIQRHVLEQTLGAAEFLHSRGLLHLLLKPSNVFVNERFEVKVADAGLGTTLLSNPAANVSAAGAMQLSNVAGWRARELLLQDEQLSEARKSGAAAAEVAAMQAGARDADRARRTEEPSKCELQLQLTSAADVFSLGCLGFYLLTNGKHPFGSRIAERDERVLSGNRGYDITVLNATEPQACDLIASMIEAKVKARPTSAAARRHPYFWDQPRRAAFICGVSRLLSQSSTVAVSARKRLNEASGASAVVRNGAWDILLDAPVLAYMTTAAEIEGRGYDRNSVHDLLRLVAFTLGQLEPEHAAAAAADAALSGWRRCISSAAAGLIGQAGGTLQYFTSPTRFPGLLMFTYWHVFKEASDAKGRHAEMWAEIGRMIFGE